MKENLIKKVIRASAGTGKTYRLSLEFIWLLLNFRNRIEFSEILVITFTRKATSEIRERIFEHLSLLVEGRDSRLLEETLFDLYEIRINEQDRTYLRSVFEKMLLNKHRLQISTIDSFVNSVFKTVIAPYLGFSSFQITETISTDNINEINEHLLDVVFNNSSDSGSMQTLFSNALLKNIQAYDAFIKSIIYNRWHFTLLPASRERYEIDPLFLQRLYQDFVDAYGAVMKDFIDYCYQDNMTSVDDIFKKDYAEALFKNRKDSSMDALLSFITERLLDSAFIMDHHKLFTGDYIFWNGSKVLRKRAYKERAAQMSEALAAAHQKLATYLYYRLILPEEQNIRKIAELVLEKYDEIKFRDKLLTYSDITFYTYKYLHDPTLSLIEDDSVTNLFYEYLSTHTRFILIDEFQDTSVIQFKILMPIIREILSGMGIKAYGGTIIVGDEKQAIYGWRGGERDLLLKMPDIIGGAEEIDLDVCYRSYPQLIRFINAVFLDERFHHCLDAQNIRWPFRAVNGAQQQYDGYVSFRCQNMSQNNENDSGLRDPAQDFIENSFLPFAKNHQKELQNTVILARRNKELSDIAAFLDQHGIEYVYESTSSVFDHRAVKPVIYLLRYFVYRDIIDLLKFLRSDFVLLSTDLLKGILRCSQNEREKLLQSLQQALKENAVIEKIQGLKSILRGAGSVPGSDRDILTFIKRIYEAFAVSELFPLENDLKNINSFLGKVAAFQYQIKEYPKTLAGFLQYIEDNRDKEAFRQQGLEEKNAVSLMTIHKSKGLEFETVFLYWPLATVSGGHSKSVQYYLQHTPTWALLEDFVLTFNYDHILACSNRRNLWEAYDRRNEIETLNTFYVAMTRAISNLYLYFSYRKKKGLQSYLREISCKDSPSVQQLLFQSICSFLQDEGGLDIASPTATAEIGIQPPMQGDKAKETEPEDGLEFVNKVLDTERYKYFDYSREPRYVDFKSVFLKHKSVILGNIVHHYLSFIQYGDQEEREYGLTKTLEFYGTLVSQDEINALIDKTNRFIDRHAELFSQKWQVFTEYTVFSPKGQEYRIDRLLVDKKAKKILIVDFKTGQLPEEEEQLQRYKETIAAIPYIKKNHFQIQTCFFKPEID